MNLTDTIAKLTEARDRTEPTTKKAANALAADAGKILTDVTEWLDEMRDAVTEAELAAEELTDCDSADREERHQGLVGELDTVIAALATE